MPPMTAANPHPLAQLIEIMARLRTPEVGCAWDLEQTFETIAPYTVEEAYEVADAIQRGDLGDLRDELGDLLFQVVFHSRMAEEAGAFAFDDVARAISEKMIRRHPHVFGEVTARTADEQTVAWEVIKAAERASKGREHAGVLDGVPVGLPALTRAVKLTARAARVGFDWPDAARVLEKLEEEVGELEAEIEGGDRARLKDELGDVLFVVANLARKLDIEPEDALREANAKFIRRFAHIEAALAEDGRSPDQSDLAEMDGLWNRAKAIERAG
jgi:MazG family protein